MMVWWGLLSLWEEEPCRTVLWSKAQATPIRMKAKVLQNEFALGGEFQRLLLRYTQALITRISQDRHLQPPHSVERNFGVGCC